MGRSVHFYFPLSKTGRACVVVFPPHTHTHTLSLSLSLSLFHHSFLEWEALNAKEKGLDIARKHLHAVAPLLHNHCLQAQRSNHLAHLVKICCVQQKLALQRTQKYTCKHANTHEQTKAKLTVQCPTVQFGCNSAPLQPKPLNSFEKKIHTLLDRHEPCLCPTTQATRPERNR